MDSTEQTKAMSNCFIQAAAKRWEYIKIKKKDASLQIDHVSASNGKKTGKRCKKDADLSGGVTVGIAGSVRVLPGTGTRGVPNRAELNAAAAKPAAANQGRTAVGKRPGSALHRRPGGPLRGGAAGMRAEELRRGAAGLRGSAAAGPDGLCGKAGLRLRVVPADPLHSGTLCSSRRGGTDLHGHFRRQLLTAAGGGLRASRRSWRTGFGRAAASDGFPSAGPYRRGALPFPGGLPEADRTA